MPPRKKENELVETLFANDPRFARKVMRQAKKSFDLVTEKLTEIIEGRVKDTWIDKMGVAHQREVPRDVVVKAAKVLKEWTLDKALADKKDAPKSKGGGELDYGKALSEVAKKKEEERSRLKVVHLKGRKESK